MLLSITKNVAQWQPKFFINSIVCYWLLKVKKILACYISKCYIFTQMINDVKVRNNIAGQITNMKCNTAWFYELIICEKKVS